MVRKHLIGWRPCRTMKFHNGQKTRDYLSGRWQRRLLFLVLSLGLVVILICESRKPQNWQWMDNLDGEAGVAAGDARHGEGENRGGDALLAGEPFEGVDRGLLKKVEDNTRFRDAENPAWFNLFGVLKRSEAQRLRRGSIGRVTWLQLEEQSPAYRGELVTVRGTARRAHRVDATQNDLGIDGYYQIWLQPDDNPRRPIVVYCLQPPRGFPSGMELDERIVATGFYFKRWLYEGRKDLETAPVILAKTVDWKRKAAVETPPAGGFQSIYLIIAGAAALALAASALIVRLTRGRPKRRQAEPADLNFNIKLNAREKPQE